MKMGRGKDKKKRKVRRGDEGGRCEASAVS